MHDIRVLLMVLIAAVGFQPGTLPVEAGQNSGPGAPPNIGGGAALSRLDCDSPRKSSSILAAALDSAVGFEGLIVTLPTELVSSSVAESLRMDGIAFLGHGTRAVVAFGVWASPELRSIRCSSLLLADEDACVRKYGRVIAIPEYVKASAPPRMSVADVLGVARRSGLSIASRDELRGTYCGIVQVQGDSAGVREKRIDAWMVLGVGVVPGGSAPEEGRSNGLIAISDKTGEVLGICHFGGLCEE
jgi:hypothetical protein